MVADYLHTGYFAVPFFLFSHLSPLSRSLLPVVWSSYSLIRTLSEPKTHSFTHSLSIMIALQWQAWPLGEEHRKRGTSAQ